MSSVARAMRGDADVRLAARAVDEAGGADDRAGMLGDRRQAFARRQAGRDDVLDHQHPRARRDRKAAPQLEFAGLALDEYRLGAEPARRLVAGHDAAERRRDHDVDVAERRSRLRGQRAAQPRGARRILEHHHLLQKHRRMQPGGQDEMALQQGAGGAEFVEDFGLAEGFGFDHAPS